jgi:predicted ATPase
LAALLAQLDGLAARQPVLMIFEDIHWIDPTSLELLTATVEHVPQLRVLLLVTARPEFTLPWPSYPHTTTVPLARLGRREGAALVERVTSGKRLPKEAMDEILARTDGVPLFIEELTKTLLETGLLQERNGHYVLERPLPALAIPTTLHASLMARLDRLAPVREVAQIGAVAGREFHYDLLSGLATGKTGGGAWPAGAVGIDFPPGRDSTRGLYFQAHAGTGCCICRPPEKPTRAAARRHRECSRATIP